MTGPALLTERQAAEQFSVKPSLMCSLAKKGEIPGAVRDKYGWRFSQDGLDDFLARKIEEGKRRQQEAQHRVEREAFDGAGPSTAWLSLLAMDPGKSNKVYFIQAASGHVKIGIAANVEWRLAALQGAHALPLTVLASFRGGREAEKYLHQFFASERVRGEWFEPSERLLAFVAIAKRRR